MGGRQIVWRSLQSVKLSAEAAIKPLRNPISAAIMTGPIMEGVLAINKPPAISSAQVIRDVQEHFNPSNLFRSWIEREQSKRDDESHNQKRKRKWRGQRNTSVKMGHGGTLDPLATGVLILGIGSGTKELSHFSTECTKSYEAIVLFGAATDTYDTEGKIVGRKPYEHITKVQVEEALGRFRGEGKQTPPIFSALRVQGKRLYEYAREGKEVPGGIEERPVHVHELEMMEWMDGGTHSYHWPTREAEKEEKQFADKMLHLEGEASKAVMDKATSKVIDDDSTVKRKAEDEAQTTTNDVDHEPARKRAKTVPEVNPQIEVGSSLTDPDTNGKESKLDVSEDTEAARPSCPAPACRIRMTVTSGFYVRSLCQDLGASVGSLGIMAGLVRTRQGKFELGTNVLWYDEFKQGEEIWGPKVKQMLEDWQDEKVQGNNNEPKATRAQHDSMTSEAPVTEES